MLVIDSSIVAHRARFALSGELVFETAAQLETELAELPTAVRLVEVDCSDLSFLDSSGVGALLRLCRHLREAGGVLVVSHLRAEIHEVLDVLGLVQILGAEGR